jgi:hypothetical protein
MHQHKSSLFHGNIFVQWSAVLILFIVTWVPFAQAGTVFSDLDPKGWYVRAVTQLADLHIISGYRDKYGQELGLFKPDGKVTIAEMLKMGFLAANRTVPDAGVPSNVSAQGDWSSSYVIAAEQMGLPLLADDLLDIHRNATRGEVIQALLGIFNVQMHGARTGFYRDVPLVSPYAVAITTATDIGITKGDTNANGDPLFTFRPNDSINRAEVASILSKLIAYNPSMDVMPVPAPVASAPSMSAQFSSVSRIGDVSSRDYTSSDSSVSRIWDVSPRDYTSSVSSIYAIPETSPIPITSDTYRVAIFSVNMRSLPTMEARTIQSLHQGDVLIVLSKADGWAEVMLSDGVKGYVVLAAIAPLQQEQETSALTGRITAAVNVRTAPDMKSSAVNSIAAGTTVIIIDQSDAFWVHIRLPDGRQGYVSSKYIQIGQ